MIHSVLVFCVIFAVIKHVFGNGYIGVNQRLLWSDAQAYCNSNYGTSLATILSAEDNAAVRAEGDSVFGSQSLWIGLHDMNNEDTFEWQDGSGEADNYYTNWSSGEPNDSGNNEDCIEMYFNGQWNDHVCSTQSRYFVCNYPTYTMFTTTLNFDDAEEYCNNNLGTNLGTITNQDAYDTAHNLAYSATSSSVWIGLRDPDGDNIFTQWNDGTSLVWDSFGSSEPSSNAEQCVEMTSGKYWNDQDCGDTLPFICNANRLMPTGKLIHLFFF